MVPDRKAIGFAHCAAAEPHFVHFRLTNQYLKTPAHEVSTASASDRVAPKARNKIARGKSRCIGTPPGTRRMSMYVFLPDKHTTLDQFQRNLTGGDWETWMKEFGSAPGDVMLPRFKIDYEIDLNDVLKTLGMGEAFDPTRANFSGVAEAPRAERLYISSVKHKTFAEVNEEGTVAAAVTSVEVQFTSAAPPRERFIMKMDRPFFVAIRDHVTGVVLFMGSVGDPQ